MNGEVYVRGERAYKFQADVATIDAVSHPNSVLQVLGTCLLPAHVVDDRSKFLTRVSTTILKLAMELKLPGSGQFHVRALNLEYCALLQEI